MTCEPEAVYNANRELNLAWQIIEETGANLFLTGRAGTGKTTFLKKLRAQSSKRMVVLAPTGVAAINANGSTIHSFFQLPFSPYIPGKGFVGGDSKYFSINRQKKRLIASLSLLVIDEISMVRPDTLDAIDQTLRRIRNSNRPFGGLQLLLIGDLRQLPPVVRNDEWQLIKDCYQTPYFFESRALNEAGYLSVELSVVYRQSDRHFLDILNNIRDGHASRQILDELNRRYIPSFRPDDKEGYIRLVTHNYQAADINNSRLEQLPGALFSFEAEIRGDFPESSYPAEKILSLREGAQVMFIKNDTGYERRYYNGLIGTVTSLSEEKIVVVPHDGNAPIEVTRAEWENTRYSVDNATNQVTQETVGTFLQYPLQLAWAITIHKSQGLTFERAIIDSARSFAAGQTYVALSRCRSLEGLVLSAPIPPQAVIVDRTVNNFVEHCENNRPDASTIDTLKQYYTFSLLSDLFDFNPLRTAFNDFARYVREFIVPTFPAVDSELHEWENAISSKLVDVAHKFINSCLEKNIASELNDDDSALAGRIRNGCSYFLNILGYMPRFLDSLSGDIDNQEYADRLNNTYDSLKYIVDLKLLMLEAMKTVNFNIHSYQNALANAVLNLDRGNKSSAPKQRFAKDSSKTRAGKKPKGYSTFETLRLFGEGKSIPRIAAERGLKEATICTHIKELISLGRIRPEEVVDTGLIRQVAKAMELNPDLSTFEVREIFNQSRPSDPVPQWLFSLCVSLRNSIDDA